MEDKSSISTKSHFIFNVGSIIFLIIFLYIVFSIYSYVTRSEIRSYEVENGVIVRQNDFIGAAVRQESVINASSSGYIHYFIQNGKRAGVGNPIYVIDETGSLEQYIRDNSSKHSFSPEQLTAIQDELTSFSQNFRDNNFSDLYDARYHLDTAALEYAGLNQSEDLNSTLQNFGITTQSFESDKAGVVCYTVDGMESLTESSVNKQLFENPESSAKSVQPGSQIAEGSPVCKLITSENWDIVFPVTDEQRTQYQDIKNITVVFPDRNLSTDASLSLYTADDGNTYGRISLNSFMEEFCSDRFIRFEIKKDDVDGLKIPLSSVLSKDFYIIPASFAVSSNGSTGFNKAVVTGSGQSTEFVPVDTWHDDDYYYVSPTDSSSGLQTGDFVVNSATGESYQIGPVKSVSGVYNINKGYCVFRRVIPVEQNSEYMIVEANADYSIAVYDHIVLDASLVKENQILYF